MSTVIVTGSGGLIGSESARHFARQGHRVIGVDNDMRAHFFGPEASTRPTTDALTAELDSFEPVALDIRDSEGVDRLIRDSAADLVAIIHTAAQPSHDWAASDPPTDFGVNATATMNLLEAVRHHAPDSPFLFVSTNKVYGDLPNHLPLQSLETRLELPEDHPWFEGIDTTMSIDNCMHSLFGVSKAAADLMVQEYGRYFEIPTVCFRGGCLSGPSHAGAKLHGFLSYLMRCTITGDHYTVFGYEGKQVRDNLHAKDVVAAFDAFLGSPGTAAVYNLGGGRYSNCSMLEAIDLCQQISGRELDWSLDDTARMGDHRWYISGLGEFQRDYPDWAPTFGVEEVLQEIHDDNVERWAAAPTRT